MKRAEFNEKVEQVNKILLDEEGNGTGKSGLGSLSTVDPKGYQGYEIQHTVDAVNQVFGADWKYDIIGDPEKIVRANDALQVMCVGVDVYFDDLPNNDGLGGTGCWVRKAVEFGEGSTGRGSEADGMKIGVGDALKKALSRLGVGRRIYRGELKVSTALSNMTGGNVQGNTSRAKRQRNDTPSVEPQPAPPADTAPPVLAAPMSENDIQYVLNRMKSSVTADGQVRFDNPKKALDFITLATGVQIPAGVPNVTAALAGLPGQVGDKPVIRLLCDKLDEYANHAEDMRKQQVAADAMQTPAEERPWNPGGAA